MSDKKPVLFTGIKPTGRLHIGHLLGTMRTWVEYTAAYDALFCIVDLHALTVRNDPAMLREKTYELLAYYLACGVDTDSATLYLQSHLPAHAELGWLLDCYAMAGELSRMTQYKDHVEKKSDNINAGLFTYPVLMAADILLFDTDIVPVGDDQKQHVELTRDIAIRVNGSYGDVLKIPQPVIPKVGARIMSLQNPDSKMSKSDGDDAGCVYLSDSNDAIMKKFKRAITDSDACVRYDGDNKKGVSNLMQIYACFTGKTYAEIEAEFAGLGYGALKTRVGEITAERVGPIRDKAEKYLADRAYLDSVFKAGAAKAASKAAPVLARMKQAVGLVAAI